MNSHEKNFDKLKLAGLFLSLGIVFGDIGTSPLYVLKAIIGDNLISKDLVYGGISCIFWTLTFQTTLKYIIITLNADNKGEGGIFSLYALVRRKAKWLVVPAVIGGSTLLADGIITPPITVTSAIEGLRIINPDIQVIPIVISIIVALFVFQQYGTRVVGNSFGGIMFLWFLMLGALGVGQLVYHPEIFAAFNPYYGYKLLTEFPQGFWILSAVFLCTTGAEALYSDLGHCGRKNIRISWIYVKICLMLNYLGQGAWLMLNEGQSLSERNPFYFIMPDWFTIYGILLATLAAVIASQALISGSFTLISEAMRLNFWPKVTIEYPTDQKGQLYIPSLNWLLMFGCISVVLYFKESAAMEAAYGLAITMTMMMTTLLLMYFLKRVKTNNYLIAFLFLLFVGIEGSFLIANLQKFKHGGWVSLFISSIIIIIMFTWFKARKIKNKFTEFVPIKKYLPMLSDLCVDETVPKYATHLVFLTSADFEHEIEAKIMYSIFNKQPKRADVFWLVHVHVIDEPYTKEYKVTPMVDDKVIRIEFRLGFRIEPKINVFIRKVIEDMVEKNEINVFSRYKSLKKYNITGDFRFVVIKRVLTYDIDFSFIERLVMNIYFLLHSVSLSEEKEFSLDTSSVTIEKVPLVVAKPKSVELKRIFTQGY